MGAQFSKTTTKGEVEPAKPEEAAGSAAKANGQENGHTKVNGDSSAAGEGGEKDGAKMNGSPAADEGLKEPTKDEGEPAEVKAGVSATTDGPAAAEDGAVASDGSDGKKKKRFSFKKPFKLGGFSFKRNKKEAGEEEAAVQPVEAAEAAPESPNAEEATTEASQEVSPSQETKLEEVAEEEQKVESPASEAPVETVEQPVGKEVTTDHPTQETVSETEAPAAAE